MLTPEVGGRTIARVKTRRTNDDIDLYFATTLGCNTVSTNLFDAISDNSDVVLNQGF